MDGIGLRDTILARPYPLVFLLVFLTFLTHCFIYILQDRIEQDALVYIEVANEILYPKDSILMKRYWLPPLLPLVMAGGHFCTGISYEVIGMIFVMALASLIPLAIFLIAREVFLDNAPALIAAVFASVHPYFLKTGSQLMRDAPYWFFFAFSLACMTVAMRKELIAHKLLVWMTTGVCTGLAICTRKEGYEIILYALLSFFIMIFIGRKTPAKTILTSLLSAIVFLSATALVCLIFYYVFNIRIGGKWELFPLQTIKSNFFDPVFRGK